MLSPKCVPPTKCRTTRTTIRIVRNTLYLPVQPIRASLSVEIILETKSKRKGKIVSIKISIIFWQCRPSATLANIYFMLTVGLAQF